MLLPLAPPVLRAYAPETVIAEKFHAMVVLGIANSRMKDFFDIWTLARTHSFEIGQLARSIRGTFERRRTSVPESAPLALTAEFLEDASKRVQWAAFGKRLGLGDLPALSLVGSQIAASLAPVIEAHRVPNPVVRTWRSGGPWR